MTENQNEATPEATPNDAVREALEQAVAILEKSMPGLARARQIMTAAQAFVHGNGEGNKGSAILVLTGFDIAENEADRNTFQALTKMLLAMEDEPEIAVMNAILLGAFLSRLWAMTPEATPETVSETANS